MTRPELTLETVRVTVHALGENSRRMPTGLAELGTRKQPLCTQDFEWTLPDGSRVRGISDPDRNDAIPACRPQATALRVPAGTPISVLAQGTTYLMATRTTAPLYPGLDAVVIEARWRDGQATFFAFLDVIVTPSSPRKITLSCPSEEQIAFEAPRGLRITPGGSAYIRGNLEGVGLGDVVEQMTLASQRETQWDGTWQVVRHNAVIGVVHFPRLDGVACSGSGVGGV